MRVEGEPSFTVGERVVVFVRDGGPYSASGRSEWAKASCGFEPSKAWRR